MRTVLPLVWLSTVEACAASVTTPTTAHDYYAEALRLACEADVRCCPDATHRWTSVEACVAGRSASDVDGLAAEVDALGATFHPDAARAALDVQQREVDACASVDASSLPPIFTGAHLAGDRCAGGLTAFEYACAPGLACNGSVCVPVAHEGDPCATPHCATGLEDMLVCTTRGICAAPASAGSPCVAGMDGAQCATGTTCDASSNLCVPLAPPGAACGSGALACAGGCIAGTCVEAFVYGACSTGP